MDPIVPYGRHCLVDYTAFALIENVDVMEGIQVIPGCREHNELIGVLGRD
jgi:hypothetical protein